MSPGSGKGFPDRDIKAYGITCVKGSVGNPRVHSGSNPDRKPIHFLCGFRLVVARTKQKDRT